MPNRKAHRTSSNTAAPAEPLCVSGEHARKTVPGWHLTGVEALGRAMTAYAELPVRLLKCTSPDQLWGEYLRFGQLLFGCFTSLPHNAVSEERLSSGGRPHKSRRTRNSYRAPEI